MSDKVAIIGYSGHGFVVAETAIACGMPLEYYCEKNISKTDPFLLKYLGFEEQENFIGWRQEFEFILGVGDNAIRNKIAQQVLLYGKKLPNVIDADASLSKHFELGVGNFIAKRVAINALAQIGNYCILNTGCIVEHESKIGDAVHIAPGAVVAGNVTIGDFSFIGANSVIKQGVTIGKNVVIGAGAVVLKNIPDHQVVVGNPGKKL